MIFEWDVEKATRNLNKHGVSFTEATTVFGDSFSLTISDPRHSEHEDRFIILGQSLQRRLLVVVHTYRENRIRIISARVANRRERQYYEEGALS
ncbi:MAG TPA: BrnT family toxin [Chloroflexia bacterium]